MLIEENRDGTVGGSFQCLHDIARHLDRSRYEPIAVFWEDNRFADQLRAAGVEVHIGRETFGGEDERSPGRRSVFARARRLASAVARRRRFLRGLGADVVHLNNSPELGYDSWLPAARLLGIPIVTHARAEAGRPLGLLRRRMVGGFDRIIAISDHVAGTLRRAGVTDRRIVRIHDGIDLDAVRGAASPPPEQTRHSLAIPAGGFFILMPGNLKRWKGQHVLLEALACMATEVRDRCYVVFAGATPPDSAAYEAELRSRVTRDGLTDRVRFLGARNDVPALMSAADVVVHASTRPEPFGLVVVEAMALGRPVIAAGAGGPTETVTPGSGVLFDPGDANGLAGALVRVLRDDALRRRLGDAGRLRADAFSIQRNVTAIEAVYDQVLPATAEGRARS